MKRGKKKEQGEWRKGARESGKKSLSHSGTEVCLWIEWRQIWHTGKKQFMKVKWETPC